MTIDELHEVREALADVNTILKPHPQDEEYRAIYNRLVFAYDLMKEFYDRGLLRKKNEIYFISLN